MLKTTIPQPFDFPFSILMAAYLTSATKRKVHFLELSPLRFPPSDYVCFQFELFFRELSVSGLAKLETVTYQRAGRLLSDFARNTRMGAGINKWNVMILHLPIR